MRRLSSLALVLAPIMFFSCAPRKMPVAAESEPESVPEERSLETMIVEESMAYYEQGLEALSEQDRERALDLFDRALDTYFSSDADFGPETELGGHFSTLVARIHEAEAEAQASSEPLVGGYDRSALERLLGGFQFDETSEEAEEPALPVNEELSFDFPVVHNSIVAHFLDYFATERAHIIQAGLERSTRYLPMIREILAEYGLPLDLCYLPLIESAYDPRARSRARAVGMWQFIAGTGKLYGLEIDWWQDQRMDPEMATRAAVRHLKDLYREFGDWNLALCAYNAGPGWVRRAIRRGGTRDFWRLYQRRLLPRETRGYVPAFLAGLYIAKKPEAYGFTSIPYQPPQPFETVQVSFGMRLADLAESLEMEPDVLFDLNPSLIRQTTPTHRPVAINVPEGSGELSARAIAAFPEELRVRGHRHTIRRGDTLSGLANAYGTTVSALMDTNQIRNPRRLSIGQVLMIPTRGGLADVSEETAGQASLPKETVNYRIKRGDTLYHLAKRFQTTIPSIVRLNDGIDPLALRAGQTLEIHQGDRGTMTGGAPSRSKGFTLYTVKWGDSVAQIARKFGLETGRLLAYNELRSQDLIHPGQRLKIPNAHGGEDQVLVYKVRSGDTLSGIATRFGTRIAKIVEWNRLSSRHRIQEGQTLLIYR